MSFVKNINLKRIFIFLSCLILSKANSQNVSTFAGSIEGFLDGVATSSQFNTPYGIAKDAFGNVFVADTQNNRIRKIAADGVVSTVAGSTQGYEDGVGTTAKFTTPFSVAVDNVGNIFVADTGNNRIRKITSEGLVSTFAGSTQGYADGLGTAAQFNKPWGIAVDAFGNVFVVDGWNHRIRKITAAGAVSTLAGSTQGFADGLATAAQFNFPYGVAVDALGHLYVTDQSNHRIRKIAATGEVSTLAGSAQGFVDGTGNAAQFNFPMGIIVDAGGNVFVADRSNHLIRKITSTGVVTTFAGSTQGFADGPWNAAQFYLPMGITVDDAGNVFVADSLNHLIRVIDNNNLGTANYYQNQVLVYPNPTTSIINIVSEDISVVKVEVFDMKGRIMISQNISNIGIINISNFANDIYHLKIYSNKVTISKKIIKQ